MMETEIRVGNRIISKQSKPFIIAELSGNHDQSFEKAKRMIKVAAEAGVDAVKLQTYTADSLTLDIDSDIFRILAPNSLWHGRHLHDLYKLASTPYEWHKPLFDYAESLGLEAFSSPFDEEAVDFLENLEVPAYKIASFELTDIPLIQKAAATGKPLILSTGMASKNEIRDAVYEAKSNGSNEIILLKCTSNYPASADSINLRTLTDMEKSFDCLVGLSDHTIGTGIAVAAIVFGAVVIEKHLVLDRMGDEVDAAFSIEPEDFAMLVRSCSEAHQAIGSVVYGGVESEEMSKYFRRSIFAYKNIVKGEKFSAENIKIIRPALGLAPKHWPHLLNKTACQDIKAGTPVTWNLIADQ